MAFTCLRVAVIPTIIGILFLLILVVPVALFAYTMEPIPRCTYTEKGAGIVDFYDCDDLPAILAKYKAEHPELVLKQVSYKSFGHGLIANFEPK